MPKHKRRLFFVPLFILAGLALFGLFVMLLWNEVLVTVVPVKKLSYGQAIGIFVLCKILFSSFRPGPPGGFRRGRHWKHKLMDLSAEEREQFRREWQQRYTSAPGEEQF